MADPTDVTHTTPGGIKLEDGFATKIGFEDDADISFWELTVQPPGLDNGDPINTSTMWNTAIETFAPQQLYQLTEVPVTCAYDPDVINQIVAIIGTPMSVTVTFPDGSTDSFFGYLRTFEPQPLERGGMPTANITVQPTAWDPDNRLEVGRVLTEVAGT